MEQRTENDRRHAERYGHFDSLRSLPLRGSFSARSRPSCGFSPRYEGNETRTRVGRTERNTERKRENGRRERRGKEREGESNNDVFRCSAPYTAWRSMPVLTPAQGRSGRAGGFAGTGRGKGGKGRAHHGRGGREEGRQGGSESERGRSTAGWRAHTSAEWKKMNKHPARERDDGPRSVSVRVSPFFLSRSLSFSLSTVVTLFQAIPRLRFTMHHADCSGGLLIPRAIPSTSKPRGNFLFLSFLHFRASHTLCFSPSFSALS